MSRRRFNPLSGGPRHHRQAALRAEVEFEQTRLERKHKRKLRNKKDKEGQDQEHKVKNTEFKISTLDKNDSLSQEKKMPETLEMHHPVKELAQLNIRGKLEARHDTFIYERILAYAELSRDPAIAITTSRYPSQQLATLAREVLVDLFPFSKYFKRGELKIKSMAEEFSNQGFTHLLIVSGEKRKKEPDTLVVILLPQRQKQGMEEMKGIDFVSFDPCDAITAYFRLTNLKTTHKQIMNKGKATSAHPELILNNFTTEGLGRALGHLFIGLFPPKPDFLSRQIVTFHNQRDFIFVRRHRYIFDDLPEGMVKDYGDRHGVGKRARLQELGPSFTMKLTGLQGGVYDPAEVLMTSQSRLLAAGGHEESKHVAKVPVAVIKSELAQAARFKQFVI